MYSKTSSFDAFFSLNVISQFGSGMSFFALSWHLMATSGSNTSVATLIVTNLVASIVFQPLGGVLADRYSRRSVLVNINWLRAFGMAFITAAYSVFHSDLLVFALGGISGAGWSLFFPASRSFIQEIADERERVAGNSLFEVSLQAGFFSSAFVAGFLYEYLGFSAIIWIDVLTFVVSNLFLMTIPSSSNIAFSSPPSIAAQLSQGLEYLLQRKWLLVFGLSMFFPFIATMAFNAVAPGYVALALHGDSRVFGTLEIGYPMGACFAGLATASLAQRFRSQLLIPVLFVCSLFSLIGFVPNERLSIAVALCFVFGFCNSSIRILMYSKLMEIVPSAVFSRVTSLLGTAATLIQVVVTLSIGEIMDARGVVGGFAILASIMTVGLGLYAISRLGSFEGPPSVLQPESDPMGLSVRHQRP